MDTIEKVSSEYGFNLFNRTTKKLVRSLCLHGRGSDFRCIRRNWLSRRGGAFAKLKELRALRKILVVDAFWAFGEHLSPAGSDPEISPLGGPREARFNEIGLCPSDTIGKT